MPECSLYVLSPNGQSRKQTGRACGRFEQGGRVGEWFLGIPKAQLTIWDVYDVGPGGLLAFSNRRQTIA